jgi:hypothetical protein
MTVQITRDEFERLFETFEHSAWRLETQGVYREDEEREPLRRFLAGEPEDFEWMRDWFDWTRRITGDGRYIGRVRVLTDPLTDYLRFELAFTPQAVDAGEDIRLLPVLVARELALPEHDYWIFDDRLAAVLHFGDTGIASVDLIDEPAVVDRYCAARQRAVGAAVAFREWAGAH